MGKNKEELARREGMSYALRLVREKGLEYAEDDLRKRGALNIPVGVDKKVVDEFVEETKMTVLDTVLIMTLVTLHDEFGMGRERLNRFKKRFNLKSECLSGDYETWQGMQDILAEECGMIEHIRNTEDLFHTRKED